MKRNSVCELAGYGFASCFFFGKTSYCRFLLPLLFFITSTVFAQSAIEIIRDPRVDMLVSRYSEVHHKKASIDGFRIQITAGSNRTSVYQTKSQFSSLFPKIRQYMVYQAPNFKLRVGNYRTRLEAYKDLQKIIPAFNGAFIIREEIKISEL